MRVNLCSETNKKHVREVEWTSYDIQSHTIWFGIEGCKISFRGMREFS